MGKRLADLLAGTSELHLLTDGKSVTLEDSERRVVDVLKSARQAMFLVCVSDQARHIAQPQRKPVRRETAPAAAARKLRTAAN
jgi:hypothetical protein